jgi:hypothetical protein
MTMHVHRFALACLLAVLGAGVACASTPHIARVEQRLSSLTMPFEANVGQQDERVAFTAHTFAGALFVTRDGELVHGLAGRILAGSGGNTALKRGRGWVLSENLVGAHPVLRADAPSATLVSRFIGNDPAKWQPSVPTYERVSLGEAWPGIGVQLAAHGGGVEKIFTIAAGADARRIAIRLAGTKRLALARNGALVVRTGNGPVTFSPPRAWQDIAGQRRSVRVAYTLSGNTYGFRLRDYARDRPVVIDPIMQSTYLGGSHVDFISAMALDAAGNVIVGGHTDSNPFPGTSGGAQGIAGGGSDGFVARLAPNLAGILQATYIGGSGNDEVRAVAVSGGNVYVAGGAYSLNLPGAAGSAQPGNAGSQDGFITKLNGALTSIIKTTYLGGTGVDEIYALKLDGPGNVYVTGYTLSTNFPHTAGGAQTTNGGSDDGFAAKLNGNLTAIVQATYFGGSNGEFPFGMVLDASANMYVVGQTQSNDFPHTLGGAQASAPAGVSGFATKLNSTLTGFVQSTYIGGNVTTDAFAVALDAAGDVFVTGDTGNNFPSTAAGAQPSYTTPTLHAFATKLNSGLTSYIQSTYLAGSNLDHGYAIALDASGNVFVAGDTTSPDFPQTAGGAQSALAGASDGYVARLNNSLTSFYQNTYLGGSGDDSPSTILLDSAGEVYVAGQTVSNDFPHTAGGAQTVFGGDDGDGFISRLTHGLHDVATATANNDGDPHFTTIDGVHYNFQGAGEYVAMRTDGGVEIQTRQTPVQSSATFLGTDEYDGISSCVSLNTAIAARAGTHRVTLEPSFAASANPAGLVLRIDGVVTPLAAQGVNLPGGGRVVQAPVGGGMEIDFADGTVLVVTPAWWAYMGLWYLNVDVFHVDDAAGLMGPIAHRSWLPALPDGTSVGPMPASIAARYTVLYGTFGNAWRVSDATTLFDYRPGTSTGTYTRGSWPPTSAPCRLPHNDIAPAKPLDLASARKACRNIGDPTANGDCILDVMLTGDEGFAKPYRVTEQFKAGATATTVYHTPAIAGSKQSAIYIATVTPIGSPTKRVPTGTVQFLLDGQVVRAEVTLDANGRAQWKTSEREPAGHDIVARYVPAEGSVFLSSSGLDDGRHG